MKKKDIKELIDAAFAKRSKPRKICDIEGVEYPDYEGKTVEEFFSNRSWDDLTLDELGNRYAGDYSAALAFMTAEAAAYYLPGFMRICIDNYDEADVLPLSLAALLLGGRSPEERQCAEALSGQLTKDQKEAVKEYLNYMRVNHEEDFIGLDFTNTNKIFG